MAGWRLRAAESGVLAPALRHPGTHAIIDDLAARTHATSLSRDLARGLPLGWKGCSRRTRFTVFLAGDDQKEELARLEGEYDALQAAAVQKECEPKLAQ